MFFFLTQGHHPTLGAHAKFTNYAFDVKEFLRIVKSAGKHVKAHKDFNKAHSEKYTLSTLDHDENSSKIESPRSDL